MIKTYMLKKKPKQNKTKTYNKHQKEKNESMQKYLPNKLVFTVIDKCVLFLRISMAFDS